VVVAEYTDVRTAWSQIVQGWNSRAAGRRQVRQEMSTAFSAILRRWRRQTNYARRVGRLHRRQR